MLSSHKMKLKPCPFCGEQVYPYEVSEDLNDKNPKHTLYCCDFQFHEFDTLKELIEAWNKRV